MCFGPCAEAEFEVKDGGDNKVGELKKYWGGCANECCSVADKYEFEFPDEKDKGKVALFLAALHMLDMCYFENPGT